SEDGPGRVPNSLLTGQVFTRRCRAGYCMSRGEMGKWTAHTNRFSQLFQIVFSTNKVNFLKIQSLQIAHFELVTLIHSVALPALRVYARSEPLWKSLSFVPLTLERMGRISGSIQF